MTRPETALDEAARELQAAEHDVRVAFDCIALGELDRAHTHALTARVATDAAVAAALAGTGTGTGNPQRLLPQRPGLAVAFAEPGALDDGWT
jgi:hypothetical protein